MRIAFALVACVTAVPITGCITHEESLKPHVEEAAPAKPAPDAAPVATEPAPDPKPAPNPAPPIVATSPRPAPPPATAPAAWPGIRVDRERRQIDLDARVVLREGDWLELVACVPGTREHEAIVTVAAKPSHIHLALLSLGLEPGHPIRSSLEDGRISIVPPAGPPVEAFFVVERDGQKAEIPVTAWVLDQGTGEPMPPGPFLFTGSAVVEHEGQRLYMADLEGSTLSLVNFGDDLLTRDTTQTNQTDNAQWGPNTREIPPIGTRLTLRLRPAP